MGIAPGALARGFSSISSRRWLQASVLIISLLALARTSSAQSCSNAIACENLNQGATGWQISNSGDPTIQGFATDISVNAGQTINFKIKTTATNYHLDIYRMGYYGGNGARLLTTISPSVSLPQSQPACVTDSTTNLMDCGNWAISASWLVPSGAVSGVYFANLVRQDTGGVSQIFWVVRNDSSHSDILFQTSDQTWAAYNDYGGHSLYGGAGTFDLNNRAFRVSYNRPFDTRSFEAATFLFNAEYPTIKWLEANGYDVTYFTGVDAARSGGLITNHKVYLTTGHDEYVSKQSRTNIEAARNAGVNMAFFTGNEVFWKTRWENSIDGSNTPFRTMTCYKETYYGTGTTYVKDPSDPPTWTGTWADPRFTPPGDGGYPQNALTGELFRVNGPGGDNTSLSVQVPAADGKMRFWRNTSIATLGSGQSATLPPGTLGYEWDADVDNGFRPAGLVPLSTSTYTMTDDLLLDYGGTYGAGTVTHHLSLYRTPNGALIFGAGTVQWAWGLDNEHDGGSNTADIRMQQATLNLLADMGVQPTTRQQGLVAATKSTDTTPPTATITSPASGATVPYGTALTISGTAADSGGGVVGAVEVSVDGGNTWHPATGRSPWSYQWFPWASSGTATIRARAIDDSGNIQSTPTSVSASVSGEPTCPCSSWSSSTTPTNTSEPDSSAVELGVKFRTDVAGYVTGVRFYKGSNNTGTHVGHLWTNQGSNLGTVTFASETNTGWQQANFASPIAISANTTYIVSYYAPNGGYADDEPFFANKGVDSPPVHLLQSGVDGGNGLYIYGTGGGFPIGTYNSGNYWVDVAFTPASPYTISGAAGVAGAAITASGPATVSTTSNSSGNYTLANVPNGTYNVTANKVGYSFMPSSQSATINGASVAGVNFTATAIPTYVISGTISGGPGVLVTLSGGANATVNANASGGYSFTVVNGSYKVTPSGTGLFFNPAAQSVTVNAADVPNVNFNAVPTASIWSSSTLPGNPSEADASAVELGLKFRSDTAGSAIGVRFYKGANNAGTHIGNLWSASGTKLATVTFSNETTSGWQQANFQSPVAIAANTTYVVSYYAPNGGYAADLNFFTTSGVDNSPLHALANGVDGANGVYLYAVGGGFPTNTYNSTNYWVDVAFAGSTGPTYSISGTVTSSAAGATLKLSGGSNATATADSSGNYSFSGLSNGTYTVTPTKAGFAFSPTSLNATINNASVTGVNFTATATAWSITGTTGVNGARLTLSGTASGTTTAGSSGSYTFTGLANGTYTITPGATGYTFSPTSQTVTVNGANLTGVNFTGTVVTGSFSISGNAGTPSATVSLTGAATATVTTDTAGNYTFNSLANGTYTVTPSKTGFTFSPAKAAVTINGANASGISFTAKIAVATDVKVSTDVGAAGSLTVSTPAFTTKAGSELLLAFIATDYPQTTGATVSSVAGAGLTWALVKRTNTQAGTAEIWRAFAASVLTNVTVTATLPKSVSSSITVVSFTGVDTSGTSGSGAIGGIGSGNAGTGAPSASLVTTRNNSVVIGVGNDYDNATARTPASGQSLIHQYLSTAGDTYWVQMQNASVPASGTTVTLKDTAPTTDRYNLTTCEVLQAP